MRSEADDAPRHCDPFLAVIGDGAGYFVEAALGLADFLSDVADVYDALAVKLRPIVEHAETSGPDPDWIAEVMRAWMSLALMVSILSFMPSAFSPPWRFPFAEADLMRERNRSSAASAPGGLGIGRRTQAARMPPCRLPFAARVHRRRKVATAFVDVSEPCHLPD